MGKSRDGESVLERAAGGDQLQMQSRIGQQGWCPRVGEVLGELGSGGGVGSVVRRAGWGQIPETMEWQMTNPDFTMTASR